MEYIYLPADVDVADGITQHIFSLANRILSPEY